MRDTAADGNWVYAMLGDEIGVGLGASTYWSRLENRSGNGSTAITYLNPATFDIDKIRVCVNREWAVDRCTSATL